MNKNKVTAPDFQTLFQAAPGLYLVLEPDFTIVAVSDAYLRATMTKREEILGRDIFDVFPDNPDEPEATGVANLRASLNRVLANRAPDRMATQKYDVRKRPEDGGGFEERYWSPLNSPVLDGRGEVAHIIHQVEDVTEVVKLRHRAANQQAAEEALRNSERWLSTTLTSIADGVIATDDADCILFMNPVAESLTGWSLQEARGRVFTDVMRLISRTNWEPLPSPTVRAARQGAPTSVPRDTLLLARDGQGVPIEDSAAPITGPEGETIGAVIVFRDTTERNRVEEELRKKERELRDFIENATIGLHWVGPDGTILWANKAELDLLGYTAEEYIGRNIADFHADPPVIDDILQRLTRDEELHSYEARLRAKDGSIRYVLISSNVYRENGEFLHTRCFTRDITARRLAEAEARERLASWRVTLASIGDAVIVTDADGFITFMNEVAQSLSGWSEEHAVGKPLHEVFAIINEITRVTAESPVEKVIREGHVVGLANHTVLISKDGTERPIEDSAAPIRDGQGNVKGVVLVFHDVSEKRKAEQLLRESEEKFRTLADSISQLAWMARPDGHIVWYNSRWYEYTGTTPEQMEGWGWQSAHHPEQLPKVVERWKASIATGEPFDMVFPIRGADGIFRPFLTRVMPTRNKDGRVILWCGTNTDITEQRRMQEQLRESDRRKDEFLAMLAHELRNPLSAISNGVLLLGQPHVDEESREWSKDVIARQVKHLSRLIEDLLDVSRVSRGKIQLKKHFIEAAPVIRQAIDSVQPLINERKHQLLVNYESPGLELEADPTRLEQIVVNLLTNAAKYTDSGGRIWLRVAAENGEVIVSVRDTGMGILPERLPEMFELFVQGDRSLARSEGGLGIGLTLVKTLVEMHGGSVRASSEGLGNGSEFTVRLPAGRKRRQDTAEQLLPSSAAGRGRKLLIVDDNVDTARGMARLLKLLGHEIQTAHSGLEALELAQAFSPDAILLDIGLPGIDGYEVATRLRKLPGFEDVLIIAVSGYGQEEDRQKSKAAGFNHHLVKPIDHDALVSLLAQTS